MRFISAPDRIIDLLYSVFCHDRKALWLHKDTAGLSLGISKLIGLQMLLERQRPEGLLQDTEIILRPQETKLMCRLDDGDSADPMVLFTKTQRAGVFH